MQIAIDGPVAAGCSTIARLIAERLGFLYIDTGAMYRAAALLAMRQQLDLHNEAQLVRVIEKAKIELLDPSSPQEQDGRLITVLLNGEDVSWQIRTDEVSQNSSVVAKYARLRQVLVKKQQQIAANHSVVMEGRDITYKVLPKADLKIYLTASTVVRAKRRHFQEQSKGRDISFEQVQAELIARDKNDMERKVDPLKIVPEAMVIDTSDLSIEQVVELIETRVRARRDLVSF